MQLRGRDLGIGMTGDDVAALHLELIALGFAIPRAEREATTFGVGTAGAVARFQLAHSLLDSASVDAATAAALSTAVSETASPTVMLTMPPAVPSSAPGAPPAPAVPPPAPVAGAGSGALAGEAPVVASGRAVASAPVPAAPASPPDMATPPQPAQTSPPAAPVTPGAPEAPAGGQPAAGSTPLTIGSSGADVAILHQALTAVGVDVDEEEVRQQAFGPTTRDAVEHLQTLMGLEPTGAVDGPTMTVVRATLGRLLPRPVDATGIAGTTATSGTLQGPVTGPTGAPLVGAVVVAEQVAMRAAHEMGRTTTDASGRYAITYPLDAGAEAPDVQLKVLAADGSVLHASPILYHVPRRAETPLPLGGPAYVEPSEYASVAGAVRTRLGQMEPVELQENDQFQDLTFLAGDTGFDRARLAIYTIAARLAKSTDLPEELFYALFRQRVPADAAVVALATAGGGVDLDRNSQRLLQSALGTSPDARSKAIETAITTNLISPEYAKRAADDLARMASLSTTATLNSTTGLGKTSLGAVLTSAGLAADKQEKFVALSTAANSSSRTFWRKLAKNPDFTKADVADLQFATTLGRFTRGHLPLINALVAMRGDGTVKGTRDLARLSAAAWKEMLVRQKLGIPANFTAQDPAQATDAYAFLLERRFEGLHPTTAFSARLAEDTATPLKAGGAVAQFLDANPSFSLMRTNVDRYLHNKPTALGDTTIANTDRATVRESLLAAQRLLKLTSRYAVAKPLLADNIVTAQQIYKMGKPAFLRTYAGHTDIGAAQAARVYAAAEQTYGLALSLAMQVNAQMAGISPKATSAALGLAPVVPVSENAPTSVNSPALAQTPQPGVKDLPNLQTLFGSLDGCSCTDCRSVLSPAAYMVDLLMFLSHRQVGVKTAKQILLARRPDLVQIELSCPNTNTVMPYIDLVNELLEDAVAPPADPTAAARARQTTLTTDELGANPQYVNEAAYTTVASAVYPWNLPFDGPMAQARTYLGVLGTDRVALMRAFLARPAIPSAAASAMAVESLGLSAMAADIITGGPLAAGNASWAYWGLAETGNTIPDPVDHAVSYTGGWMDVLAHVRVLLDRSGLTYPALTQMLNTVFVNPGNAATIQCDPPTSCDLGSMTLVGLTEDVLNRLRRFVLLTRALGWDAYAVDAAITLLQLGVPAGLSQLNESLLRQLAAVASAMKRLRIPAAAALTFWTRIDTRIVPKLPGEETRRTSLYENLFANLAVLSPVDPIFTLNPAGTEIDAIATNPRLTDHRPALISAFELSDEDLVLAIGTLTDGALSLANLSVLYRSVVLARALGLSVSDLVSLRALIEVETPTAPFFQSVDPFDAANPESLGVFCDEVDRVRATHFSVAGLDDLLRNTSDPSSGVAPDAVTVGTLLKSIRDGFAKIATENTDGADPTGVEVRRRLAMVLPPAGVQAIQAVMAGVSTASDGDQLTLVTTTLGPFMDATATGTALVGGAALAPGSARYEYVLTALLAYLRQTLGTSFVAQQLADALGLPIATVVDLMTSWLPSPNDAGKPVITDFLALAGVVRDAAKDNDPIEAAEAGFGVYFTAYTALAKAAQVLVGIGFGTSEITWLRAHGVGLGWLDPTTLPLTATATAQGRYRQWRRLVDAAKVKATLANDGTPYTALMDLARGGADKTTYIAALGKRTGWSAQSLRALAGDPTNTGDHGSLGLVYPDDFRSERALARLSPAFALLSRLGISTDVTGWLGATMSAAQADAIKSAVKAKYSNDAWPAVAKPLQDVLREQQRDALVAYVLAHPPAGEVNWRDANDVYAHYLIDVEMSSCQGTSRIVQANATIQLFVQRCILNLEPGVTVDAVADPDWLQWQWLSRYRVWEANREVFLYPENWIEPALRTDKSPFFAELESDLLQNDVTDDSAEDAYRAYLEKLEAVARLEVMGVYHEAGEPDVLHVVARKMGDPPIYYYRRWIDATRWTAWTKMDLDIVSDHVLPLVWNHRLYLFWAVINRKPDRAQTQPSIAISNTTPPDAKIHLEVQLAWSEFKGHKWLPKQTAPQTLILANDSEPFFVTLKSSINDPLLRIDVFANDNNGNSTHFGEYVLGGTGHTVEAYVVSLAGQQQVGPQTRDVGKLSSVLYKGSLLHPTNSVYDAMTIRPASSALSELNSARPRVAPLYTSYSLYGAITSEIVFNQADNYRILVPHQDLNFDSTLPFFYADARRTYFAIPSVYYQNGNYFTTTAPPYVYRPNFRSEYAFEPFYHAFVPLMLSELNRGGLDALFARKLQINPAAVSGVPAFDFKGYYSPTALVINRPAEGIDFEYNAGYAIYNWELFYHAPFQIGEALSRNQQFEKAKHWYEYIFNPTSATTDAVPQRYWVTKPFYQMTAADYRDQQITNLLSLINSKNATAEHEVAQWRANPFDPHIIAGLRPVAYQRTIVMKYIDNLIAWGDQLFSQDTMESVNEATQLYVLAAELLGPRPEIVPQAEGPARTYADLEPSLDDFANAVTAAENALSPVKVNVPVDPSTPKLPILPTLYFCIPPNEQLMAYWDLVADRLFKVRHCMNIEGVTRQLALFAPPIDPGMLVKAAAAGLDLGSVLNDTSAALPPYRFRVILGEAIDLAQSVRALGADLLNCLQARDAEKFELLRSGSERKLQSQVSDLRQRQVDEAGQQIDVLAKNRKVVEGRQAYFDGLRANIMNSWEIAAMAANAGSMIADAIAGVLHTTSGAAHMVVSAQFGGSGAGGSPHVTVRYGGDNVGHGSDNWAKAARVASALLQTTGAMATALAQYNRRQDEWNFESSSAGSELAQIDSQSLAATIRQDIAARERDTHAIVAKLAADADDYLHSKFTNADLYDWMITKTSGTYFQAYQLAFTVARRAEQCMRRELGLSDSSYIQFGYWDSLKKGLLAADNLLQDLRRMEAAYYAQNARELELTKNASLLMLDPQALLELRTTGECTVSLPELWFDLDTPGHYMRRFKTVGVTVPCVVGPYTGVPLTLTLLSSQIRTGTGVSPSYPRQPGTDIRFLDQVGGDSAIVTSTGQNDSGLFELRLDDERYLPFEGAGAISTWKLKLGAVFPQFDYDTISDVVLHLRYTARDGGDTLAAVASASAKSTVNAVALAESRHGLYRLISPRQEYGTAWTKFLSPGTGNDQILTLDLAPDRFPFFTNGLDIKVTGFDVMARLSDIGDYTLVVTPPGAAPRTVTMSVDTNLGGLHHVAVHPMAPAADVGRAPTKPPYPVWTVKLCKAGAADFRSLAPDEIDDLIIVLKYEVSP